MKFHLEVEGVNFASCLYDTNDISVIRGSSLLLDSIAEPVTAALQASRCQNIEREWAGASTAKFTFEADEAAAQAALETVRSSLSKGPYRHLSFVANIGQSDVAAKARNRAAQFRQWTVPECQVPDAILPDALDGMRPASAQSFDSLKGALSPSVKARLDHGRKNRHGFFASRVPDLVTSDVALCDSFHDMVRDAPNWVPETVAQKLAVLHFDGDGFGAARRAAKSAAAFSDELNAKMQNLLRRLVHGAIVEDMLRLEVLVWGGDDITLVVPAWHALDCLKTVFAETAEMTLAGQAVSFTGAAIVANYKAPIRQLTALAEEAVYTAKQANARGGFTFDAFESAAPPEKGLAEHRVRVFGQVSVADLSIPHKDVSQLLTILRDWKTGAGESMPSRSRLYDLLSAPLPEGLTRDAFIERELDRDVNRLEARGESTAGGVFLPTRQDRPRAISLDLKLAATLWDYVPECVVAPSDGQDNDEARP